jgi:hypothetical protein
MQLQMLISFLVHLRRGTNGTQPSVKSGGVSIWQSGKYFIQNNPDYGQYGCLGHILSRMNMTRSIWQSGTYFVPNEEDKGPFKKYIPKIAILTPLLYLLIFFLDPLPPCHSAKSE